MAPIKPKSKLSKFAKPLPARIHKSANVPFKSISTAPKSKSTAPNPKKQSKPDISTTKKSSKPEKMEKPIFAGKIICSIGVYLSNDKIVSHDDVARWVRLHGGQYVKEFTEDTTHLLCSIEVFQSAIQLNDGMNVGKLEKQVQRALRLGKRKCKIVVWDWLEDSLVGKNKSCKRETQYLLTRVMNRLERGLKITPEFFRRFEEGVRSAEEMVNNTLYHIACDETGFDYKVILSRSRTDNAGKVTWEKYTLYLYESNALPHVYMVGAKLSRPTHKNSLWREWCHPMDYYEAFKHFQRFFLEKTGISWDDRLEPLAAPIAPPIGNAAPKKGRPKKVLVAELANEEMLDEVKSLTPLPDVDLSILKFKYTRPQLPRPLGLLPFNYVLPEHRPDYIPPKSLHLISQDKLVDFEFVEDPNNPLDYEHENGTTTSSQRSRSQSQLSNEVKQPSPQERKISPLGSNANPINMTGYDSDSEVEEEDESPVRSFNVSSGSTHFSTLYPGSQNGSNGSTRVGSSKSNSQVSRALDNSHASGTGSFHTRKSHLSSQISAGSREKVESLSSQATNKSSEIREVIVISDSESEEIFHGEENEGDEEVEAENTPISPKYYSQSRSQSTQSQLSIRSALRAQVTKPTSQPRTQSQASSTKSASISPDANMNVSYEVHSPGYSSSQDQEHSPNQPLQDDQQDSYQAPDTRDPMDFDSQLKPQQQEISHTRFMGYGAARTRFMGAENQVRQSYGGYSRQGFQQSSGAQVKERYGGYPKQVPVAKQQHSGGSDDLDMSEG